MEWAEFSRTPARVARARFSFTRRWPSIAEKRRQRIPGSAYRACPNARDRLCERDRSPRITSL